MFGSSFEVNGLGQGSKTHVATNGYSFHATPGNTAGLDEIFILFSEDTERFGITSFARGPSRVSENTWALALGPLLLITKLPLPLSFVSVS